MATINVGNYKILIVDDEAELRKSVCRGLNIEGYENLVEASNGQEAKEILGQEKFDLIISDVKMPKMHGIALLHHVRRTQGSLPFILMTGFSDVMETTEAIEIGASGFLLKPFSIDDIINEIQRIQGEGLDKGFEFKLNSTNEPLSNNFCPIPIIEFTKGSKADFPIYLKLNENKFLKIANMAEDIDLRRVRELEKKGVYYFYAEKEDFKRFALLSNEKLNTKINSLQTSKKDKEELIKRTGNILANYSFSIGVDEVIFDATLTNLKQSLSMISDKNDVFKVLEQMSHDAEDLYGHSMGVCLVSLMLAREIGIESSLNIYKISVASFFHDIGLRQIPEKIYKKSIFRLFDDELALFQTHPKLSADELLKLPDVTTDIGEIILQHHEKWNGTGFPNGLSKEKIHPIARILSIADEFCYHLTGGLGYKKLPNPGDSLRELEKERDKFDPKLLKALKNIYSK